MRHTNKILWCMSWVMFCSFSKADVVSDWFNSNIAKPFERDVIKPFERDVIKPIERDVVKPIEKAFIDFGKIFEKQVIAPVVSLGDTIVTKFKDCGNVVALGSEWAAKKAAFESAQAALAVVTEINNADPLSYGVYATKQAALLGLDAGQLGAEGLTRMMEGLGTIIGGGFNITEVLFDVQAKDLEQGKLPLFQLKGIFFGKPCQLSFQFDVNKPDASMDSIIKELIKLVPGV